MASPWPYLFDCLLAIISGIMMSMQSGDPTRQPSECIHGFPAVDGDMTFAVAGKKKLQKQPAG